MKKTLLALIASSSLVAQYNFLLGDELDISTDIKIKKPVIKTVKPKAYYTFLPYVGMLDYSKNTTKDEGYVSGIYFSIFDSPFKTEIDIEQTSISYTDTTSDLAQGDFSLLVHYYKGYNLDYKMGMHYIDSTDTQTDGGMIYTLGILYYKTLSYNYGLDIHYSDYSNLDTSPKILQFTPKVGFNFGNYYSFFGSFYAEAKYYYIQNLDTDNTYSSSSFELSNYNGKFTTTIGFWSGERIYAVDNGGFIVNNLSNKQTEGFKFSESYKINKISSIKFEYSNTKFEESGEAESSLYLLSYSYSF